MKRNQWLPKRKEESFKVEDGVFLLCQKRGREPVFSLLDWEVTDRQAKKNRRIYSVRN